ncbi:VirB4 family type IV secretion/conjugal transfer ATPase [Bartonella sp. AR 15-3]|uniref:VirB4 family type IV secretion/conjugal transfer ATPase n=1 Tax=Bartonella sp. AR 15-3 TaxID=545617 RepID=UPI0001F4B9EB|nr:VirB4 family type IV secretion/conjugal transfer ATPase [Bartonella sp. AR 15-3]OPB31770.1 type IV secretion system protein VirB4 [Bartonella sp. AR 15-3]OPB31794.1 type IV secretion system protein VirB4 [Bartonella sp. AR 15-3]OPB32459.1 type IV secretion system protein VirB4 [Bartonella sp. AR 15-3]CBI78585.1 Type IV secretion system protein VirB4 [Bartonella sp. AR 15-3]CBI79174.1 Type IV secretion system protein VirB4 [Bartonella sp. AR 15-3]
MKRESKRESLPEEYIPYVRHVNQHVIALASRCLMTVITIEGVNFDTADISQLNSLHTQLNTLLKNIADERVALYSHIIRRREKIYPESQFSSSFATVLDQQYKQKMVSQDLYQNDLFLSVLWNPAADKTEQLASFFHRLTQAKKMQSEPDFESIRKIEELSQDLIQGLECYGARLLSTYEYNDILFSEQSEFLHQLVGGRRERVPLTFGTIASTIYSDRIIFGKEIIEIRHESNERFVGMFGWKEYPSKTRPGMTDGLLTAPFEFILTQSFVFKSKAVANAIMSRKQNQMINVADRASSQIGALDEALDDLESNRFVLGEHHLSLAVFSDRPQELAEHLSKARSYLTNGGAVIAREDLGLEAAWWAQLPGNFSYRARSGAISSRNFAALSPFHSFPVGKLKDNVWGSAVALLQTQAGSPYYFNFHCGDVGNTFICGPSGSGKTVIVNFLLAQSQKHNPTIVFFDKDQGAEIFVRAGGGKYKPLKNGKPTGIAPLKGIEYTEKNKLFLQHWILKLVTTDGQTVTEQERQDVARAINALETLPLAQRSLGALQLFFDNTSTEGIAIRLKRWIKGNPLGWVFDNDHDDLNLDAQFIGYDMTDFLDNEEIRRPLMMYLFNRILDLIDGRRIIIVIDEFWKALEDDSFKAFTQDRLKTIRKQNGMMLFATQSPRDALNSTIAHTIIEQCPTQIFFPNQKANYNDYVENFKLTEREFELIQSELSRESRRFLIKQGQNSVVAELNLRGMDNEIAVLSGTTRNIELVNQIISEHGTNPNVWLPIFYRRRHTQ